MRISTLIKKLTAVEKKYGDLAIKKDDGELGFLPATYLGIDGIDNVSPRWTRKTVAEVQAHRKKAGFPPLPIDQINYYKARRPIHKPKFVWL